MSAEFSVVTVDGVEKVDIKMGGKVVAYIYPNGEDGIKIISAHVAEAKIPEDFSGKVLAHDGNGLAPPIPSIDIEFKFQEHHYRGKKIIYHGDK